MYEQLASLMAMPSPLPQHWSASGFEWQVDLDNRRFNSPYRNEDSDQILLSDLLIKDGSISGRITFGEGAKRDAGFVFRQVGDQRGYIAGMGGWNSRFSIARMVPGDWRLVASAGLESTLYERESYLLRVEFSGNQIRVYENDVLQLTGNDATYVSGQVGLQASGVKVRFSDIQLEPERRRCFVAMPFSEDFNKVREVIKQTAEANHLLFVRADELYGGARPIMDDIRAEMDRPDIIIADLTGKNPNVYYEAGLAGASGKPCIIVAEALDDLSFDLRHLRAVFYSDRKRPEEFGLKTELTKHIRVMTSLNWAHE